MTQTEKTETATVGLQFSLYPLRQAHVRPAIEAAVRAATREGVEVTVGRLSSFASADEDAVFAAVRASEQAKRRNADRTVLFMARWYQTSPSAARRPGDVSEPAAADRGIGTR